MTQAPVTVMLTDSKDVDPELAELAELAGGHDASAFADDYPETAALILAMGAELARTRAELDHYKRLFAGAASSPLARSVLGTLGLDVAHLDPAAITGAGKLTAAAAGWPAGRAELPAGPPP